MRTFTAVLAASAALSAVHADDDGCRDSIPDIFHVPSDARINPLGRDIVVDGSCNWAKGDNCTLVDTITGDGQDGRPVLYHNGRPYWIREEHLLGVVELQPGHCNGDDGSGSGKCDTEECDLPGARWFGWESPDGRDFLPMGCFPPNGTGDPQCLHNGTFKSFDEEGGEVCVVGTYTDGEWQIALDVMTNGRHHACPDNAAGDTMYATLHKHRFQHPDGCFHETEVYLGCQSHQECVEQFGEMSVADLENADTTRTSVPLCHVGWRDRDDCDEGELMGLALLPEPVSIPGLPSYSGWVEFGGCVPRENPNGDEFCTEPYGVADYSAMTCAGGVLPSDFVQRYIAHTQTPGYEDLPFKVCPDGELDTWALVADDTSIWQGCTPEVDCTSANGKMLYVHGGSPMCFAGNTPSMRRNLMKTPTLKLK